MRNAARCAVNRAICILLLCVACPAQAQTSDPEKIEVLVRIQDEAGYAVPHVTVWGVAAFDAAHIGLSKRLAQHSAAMDELWQATLRYADTADLATRYGEKPAPFIRLPRMADAAGRFEDAIEYEVDMGQAIWANKASRPVPFAFGYTFIKRGYEPARLEFRLGPDELRAQGVVTLKRSANAQPPAPYWEEYDALRYELSDTRTTSTMTIENMARLQDRRAAMHALAQTAELAGDRRGAAQIYLRMRYLPTMVAEGSQIVSFLQSDYGSPQAQAYLQRAYELAPAHPFARLEMIAKSVGAHGPSPTVARARRDAAELEKLIAHHKTGVWPRAYAARADLLALSGQPELSYKAYKEAMAYEPKYSDWETRYRETQKTLRSQELPPLPAW